MEGWYTIVRSDVDILCVAGIGMGIGKMTYHKTDKA